MKDDTVGFSNLSRVLIFLTFSRFLLHSAPWHTCSGLNVLPAPLGFSKINMTCPDSVLFLPSGMWLAAIKLRVEIKGRLLLRKRKQILSAALSPVIWDHVIQKKKAAKIWGCCLVLMV